MLESIGRLLVEAWLVARRLSEKDRFDGCLSYYYRRSFIRSD